METEKKEKMVLNTLQELIDYLNSCEDGAVVSVMIEMEEVSDESEQ